MEDNFQHIRDLRRHLNSIEHMLYVSCKFTRTTEMLKNVMETLVSCYEQFFSVAYSFFVGNEENQQSTFDKIKVLNETLSNRGLNVDISDYFLLKKLLMSESDSIGEYRKNLALISYIDGEEYTINIQKLFSFFENLKGVCSTLNPQE